ncbi:putative hydroxypyruvate isomerase [Nymphon striatum]|nr:putative hydroxypyruvate isomerase [Nymphon striatum]
MAAETDNVMACPKFAANVSLMFLEYDKLALRYKKAAEAGFKAVECVNPFETPLEELVEAKSNSGLKQVHINCFAGDNDEKGFAAVPGKEKEFHESLLKSIEYAKGLDCSKIHIMSGKINEDTSIGTMKQTYLKNLRDASKILEKRNEKNSFFSMNLSAINNGCSMSASSANFQTDFTLLTYFQENIIGLIEPVNEHTIFNYYMNDFKLAEEIVKAVHSPNMRLQLDVFHLQIICGNMTRNIQRLLPLVGHIQVSQAPNRDELDAPGEINYPYIFKLFNKFGYNDYIGLEYKPSGPSTEKSLSWIKKFGYSL